MPRTALSFGTGINVRFPTRTASSLPSSIAFQMALMLKSDMAAAWLTLTVSGSIVTLLFDML
jgi:hypothetical protein